MLPAHLRTHSPRRAVPPGAALALAGLLTGMGVGTTSTPAEAQTEAPAAMDGGGACPGGVLSRIEIRNHSLFAPEDIEGHRFQWALGFANWIHVRTRREYVRQELLVREGGCYDPTAVDESLRNLRDLDFIARVEATPTLLPDSSWAVRVQTWDEWTTQVGVNFDVEGRFQFKGAYITEKNLLGRGLRLSFRYHDFRERNDRSLALSTNRFLGTRATASVEAGTTRTGHYFGQTFSYPFFSEASRWTVESQFSYEDREFSYLTGNHDDVSHVLLPFRDVQGGALFARRYGEPGALALVGAEVDVRRRTVSGPVRQVYQGDFDHAIAAHDSLTGRLAPQDAPDSWVRLGGTVGLRRLRFTTARGLDRVSGEQNVALGADLKLTVGRALGTWGTEPGGYSYGQALGFLSARKGSVLAFTSFRAEGRRLDDPADRGRWRDLVLWGRGMVYVQPGPGTLNTFVTGTHFKLHGNRDQPGQIALGGEEGVRSYREDQVPASSVFVAFAEHRLNLPWFRPAMDLGVTVFGDVGQGWAGDAPFAVDTGWRKAAGVGLRLGFPAGTGSVTRLELAWPVGGPDAGRGPVFRTYWSPAPTSR